MAKGETVLVTGANGFIGGWIVETLHLRQSATVRAGVTSWARAVRPARFPVEIVLCDVLNPEQIVEAMAGVHCVIHCASGAPEVIEQGTGNVLEAARRLGVARVVHLSTAEVYGSTEGLIDETLPLVSTGSPYSDVKIQAERLCWSYYVQGLPVTVIRPSIVYGPFSKDWTMRLAASLQSGNWCVLKGLGEGSCNLIYVSDLVSGVLRAMESAQAVGQAFNLTGPDIVTWNDYFRQFNAALGLPELRELDPEQAQLGGWLMATARSWAKFALAHSEQALRTLSQRSTMARRTMKSAERKLKTAPRIEEFELYGRKAHYASQKASQMLGFQPRIHLDQGLDLTVKWLIHVGLAEPV